jgi:hypothetical protein
MIAPVTAVPPFAMIFVGLFEVADLPSQAAAR